MTGTLALHGGGEFLAGDEPFLAALLEAAPPVDGGPIRITVVPTAAARDRPELAAANGVAAFERVAADLGLPVAARSVMVVDGTSAADPVAADALAAAHVIHLPGGDPDLIPAILPGTLAADAIDRALARGAVLAGASAGAMAMAEVTWTPTGFVRGLGLVPGLLVVPHADARSWDDAARRFGADRPAGLGALGLAERTGVVGHPGGDWRIVGPGEVRWLAPGATTPDVATAGVTLDLRVA